MTVVYIMTSVSDLLSKREHSECKMRIRASASLPRSSTTT